MKKLLISRFKGPSPWWQVKISEIKWYYLNLQGRFTCHLITKVEKHAIKKKTKANKNQRSISSFQQIKTLIFVKLSGQHEVEATFTS